MFQSCVRDWCYCLQRRIVKEKVVLVGLAYMMIVLIDGQFIAAVLKCYYTAPAVLVLSALYESQYPKKNGAENGKSWIFQMKPVTAVLVPKGPKICISRNFCEEPLLHRVCQLDKPASLDTTRSPRCLGQYVECVICRRSNVWSPEIAQNNYKLISFSMTIGYWFVLVDEYSDRGSGRSVRKVYVVREDIKTSIYIYSL